MGIYKSMDTSRILLLLILGCAVWVANADDNAEHTTETPETTTVKRKVANFEYKVFQGFEYAYYLVGKKRLWTQAQRICRIHFKGELASHGLESTTGRQQLLNQFSDEKEITEAWLGFQRKMGTPRWKWEWVRADGTPLASGVSLDGWLRRILKYPAYNYILVHLYDPLLKVANIRSTYRSTIYQVYNHYERRKASSTKQRRYFICEKKNSFKEVQERKQKEFAYAAVAPDSHVDDDEFA